MCTTVWRSSSAACKVVLVDVVKENRNAMYYHPYTTERRQLTMDDVNKQVHTPRWAPDATWQGSRVASRMVTDMLTLVLEDA